MSVNFISTVHTGKHCRMCCPATGISPTNQQNFCYKKKNRKKRQHNCHRFCTHFRHRDIAQGITKTPAFVSICRSSDLYVPISFFNSDTPAHSSPSQLFTNDLLSQKKNVLHTYSYCAQFHRNNRSDDSAAVFRTFT